MDEKHKNKWNRKAKELLNEYSREIVFINKKVRGGFTYSTIINSLLKGYNILFVGPTYRLVNRELNRILDTAEAEYDIKIKDNKIIKWPGKKRVCERENDEKEKYPFGRYRCSSCEYKKRCDFKLAPKNITENNWRIVGLTLSKLENVYTVTDDLFHYKRAMSELLDRTDIVIIDECRYLTNMPSFFDISQYNMDEDLSSELAKNIKLALQEENEFDINPDIGFRTRDALYDMLNPEEEFTTIETLKGFKKPLDNTIKVKNEHDLGALDIYYGVLAGLKRASNIEYSQVLNITPLLSSDWVYRYKNGKYEVKQSVTDNWSRRGEICKDFRDNGATVFLSDATNRVKDIKACLDISTQREYGWGDPQSISKKQLIIYDSRGSVENIFTLNTERKKRQKNRVEDLIWETKELTQNDSFILSLSKEKIKKVRDWDLPEEIISTYYRSDLCTGVGFDGRLGIFLGLPHTPDDSFLGEGFERAEEEEIRYSYPDSVKNLDPPSTNIDFTDPDKITEEEMNFVGNVHHRNDIRKRFEKKLRWQEIKEQYIQTSGRVLDPLGEEKSVVISLFTKGEELKEKIYGDSQEKKKPLFTKTLTKGKHEKDAKVIAKAWLNDVFEKSGIEDSQSFGVYARLYNYRNRTGDKVPDLSSALRYWGGRWNWKENNPDFKDKFQKFFRFMEEV